MRRFVLSLAVLVQAGFTAYAQNDTGTLQGVYAPPGSVPGKLGGVYGSPQLSPTAPLKSTLSTDPGIADHGPTVSISGSVSAGQSLPEGVNPSPIPGRPGYGRAMVNGHPAVIDMGNNRIVQYSD